MRLWLDGRTICRMAVPTVSFNISGNVIAIYAAALATATAVVQLLNFYKDRAKVKLGRRTLPAIRPAKFVHNAKFGSAREHL